jgi:hypothetical protein
LQVLAILFADLLTLLGIEFDEDKDHREERQEEKLGQKR